MTYRIFCAIQAGYYLLSGVWPLVSMSTFMLLTGYKTDQWLVEMVGLLAASIGTGLVWATFKNSFASPFLLLLILCAASFAWIDLRYSLAGLLNPVYTADALLQVVFIFIHTREMLKGRDDNS